MEKYISVKAAIEAVSADNLISNLDSVIDEYYEMYHRAAERAITGIPLADVRPVVLCRDCTHSHYTDKNKTMFCDRILFIKSLDFFCADGEKREVEHSQEPT